MSLFDWSVVGIGVGTVFVGLACIILICALTSAVVKRFARPEKMPAQTACAESDEIPDRRAFVAALSVAIAEDLGTRPEAIRIHSIKKL